MPEPIDVTAVASDDALIEDLLAGAQPPSGDQVAAVLKAWREDVDR